MRKELPLLASTLFLGSMLLSPPDGQAQSCQPPAGYELGRIINNIANFRVAPNTQSEILQVLGLDSEILLGEEVEGQMVSFNGVSSDSWREVFLPETCESGFVWTGLLGEPEEESEEYDSLVFANCPYYFVPGNITSMAFNYQAVASPEAVMASLQNWQGRSLWRSYADANPLGIPNDAPEFVHRVGSLRMNLKRNEIPGQVLESDLTGVWFYEFASNPDEIYVFPFRSFTTFADANGEHEGAHLCGDHAVPRGLYEEFANWLGGN